MSLEVDVKGLARVEAELKGVPKAVREHVLPQAIRDVTVEARNEAREIIKDKPHWITGKLYRTVAFSVRQTVVGVEGTVGSPTSYAPFLEYGTRPHEIVPLRAKALRFVVDGQEIFAKRVQHPGNPPFRIFGRAVEAAEKTVADKVHRAIARHVK